MLMKEPKINMNINTLIMHENKFYKESKRGGRGHFTLGKVLYKIKFELKHEQGEEKTYDQL